MGTGRSKRLWWAAFLGLTCMGVVWALAVPPMTGTDEAAHAIRSAAVARGEWVGKPTESYIPTVNVRVPEAYALAAETGNCFVGEGHYDWDFPARQPQLIDCVELDGTAHEVDAITYEHRIQPTYYLLTGWPSLFHHGELGFYLMRVVGVVVCAALLATGLTALLHLEAPRVLVVGSFLVLSPTMVYFASTVNPSGVELSAAFCAWATGLRLVRAGGQPHWRHAAGFGLALSALATARPFGLIFVALVVVFLCLAAPAGRVRELLANQATRRAMAGTAVAMAATTVWIVYIQTEFPTPTRQGAGMDAVLEQSGWWLRELVGIFGMSDVAPPAVVQLAWGLGLAILVALTVRRVPRRDLLLAAAVATVSVAIIVSGEAFSIPDSGYFWQARHVQPLLLGAPLLAVVGLRGPTRISRWGPALLLLTVGVHVWSLIYALRHYTLGWTDESRNPLTILLNPIWSPPLPSIVLAGAYAGALLCLATIMWRAASRAESGLRRKDAEISELRTPARGQRALAS